MGRIIHYYMQGNRYSTYIYIYWLNIICITVYISTIQWILKFSYIGQKINKRKESQKINFLLFLFDLNFLKGVAVISVFFICVSVLSFCLKTHPSMRVPFLRNITVNGPGNASYFLLDKVKTGIYTSLYISIYNSIGSIII